MSQWHPANQTSLAGEGLLLELVDSEVDEDVVCPSLSEEIRSKPVVDDSEIFGSRSAASSVA
jgi:hypothetical protein